SAAQAYQELDNRLRQLDVTMRSDLSGVTCKMTPPNNPQNSPGYFEYIENEFADLQGEDADDCLRFTAKAPPGRPFTGRMWVPPPITGWPSGPVPLNLFLASYQPITIQSDFAEIIYFLRNGNLYRRVLLIAPERQSSIVPTSSSSTLYNAGFFMAGGNVVHQPFQPYFFGSVNGPAVSWQGMNDISAHPAPTGPDLNALITNNSIVLNTLGHLTNRENRFPAPRFANDFQGNLTGVPPPDNKADDFNNDNVPDCYPTLYAGVFTAYNSVAGANNVLINEPPTFSAVPAGRSLMAFPFVYPGAYSCPQVLSTGTAPYGWIHSPNPQVYNAATNSSIAFDANPLQYLLGINHNPIDLGDNLPLPPFPTPRTFLNGTWWGFPTWRETLSANWTDPTWQLNTNQVQPAGLTPRLASVVPVNNGPNLLPPMRVPGTYAGDFSYIRRNQDFFSDGWGGNSAFWFGVNVAIDPLWSQSWEDDLIMTGVRSFDVKAYDMVRGDYADLGWGDDCRVTGLTTAPFLAQTPLSVPWQGRYFDVLNQSFAHEGRMPPLVLDNRYDAQYGPAVYPGYPNYNGNIGDDQPGIVRLRRVWDSWSTDYTRAPGTAVATTGFPMGPPFGTPPVYPSYPPPYPAPLRGIQIQIRVTDPTNQRIKSLTIRQDFTDKL
ncbi:MAG: PulJ/GspJ family protein, partial [Isosphaeraceae bacterium]